MGIRYYAYPVPAIDAELARIAPYSFMSDDPLMDAWGSADERPMMLYLDKCWRELQALFGPNLERPARPAFDLVEGQVIMHSEGWEAAIRVLDPGQVAAVAADLDTVGADEVAAMFGAGSHVAREGEGADRFDEVRYVMEYLNAAKEFTAVLSRNGWGLVYLIG